MLEFTALSDEGVGADGLPMTRRVVLLHDMKYHWIRDRIKQGHFSVVWRKGADNLADFFTIELEVSIIGDLNLELYSSSVIFNSSQIGIADECCIKHCLWCQWRLMIT